MYVVPDRSVHKGVVSRAEEEVLLWKAEAAHREWYELPGGLFAIATTSCLIGAIVGAVVTKILG